MTRERYTWADLPDGRRIAIIAVTSTGMLAISLAALRNLGWSPPTLSGQRVLRSGDRAACLATACPDGLRIAVPADASELAGARFEARLR